MVTKKLKLRPANQLNMPVTRSQTRRAANHNTTVAPATLTPMCRRSQRILHATQQAVELAPAPVPVPAPTLRRSKRLQGRPPSPSPCEEPPRARAPARPQPIAPPLAPVRQYLRPQHRRPTMRPYRLDGPLPMWPLTQRQHWEWVIPAHQTGYWVDDLNDTTNVQHMDWNVRYPLAPSEVVEVIPGTQWGYQPTVEEGFLWDMI